MQQVSGHEKTFHHGLVKRAHWPKGIEQKKYNILIWPELKEKLLFIHYNGNGLDLKKPPCEEIRVQKKNANM